jgi:hypothetical protein
VAAPRATVTKSTQSVGYQARLVTISAITPDGKTAICVDRQGIEVRVSMAFQPAKGILPMAGEQWIVTQDLANTWTFAAIATNDSSVFTNSGVSGSGPLPPGVLPPPAPGSIPGSAIAPGSLTGTQIAAQTITNLNLATAAAATNIILDPQFTSSGLNAVRLGDPGTTGTWTLVQPNASVAGGPAVCTLALMPSTLVPLYVNAGEQYYLSVSVTLPAGTGPGVSAGIQFAFNDGSFLGPVLPVSGITQTVAQLITVPPGEASAYVRLIVTGLPAGVVATFTAPVCYITQGPNQMQPGSVGNANLQANSVSANNLQAGSVSTNALQANSITSSKIQANQITAAQLVTGIVVAGIVNSTIVEGSYFISGAGGGTTWESAQPSTPGYFMYYDDGTDPPQLIFSIAAAPGTDQWGNSWQGGATFVGMPGIALNTLTVTDTSGDVLAAIDSGGNISAQSVNVTGDVLIGGSSTTDALAPDTTDFPLGIVNYGFIVTGSNWPSTAVGTTETALFELDLAATAGRAYEFILNPGIFVTNTAGQIVHLYLRYTSDGSTPTTGSTMASSVATYVTNSGSAQGHPGLRCLFTPTANITYRFLVTGNVTSGTFQFASADPYIRCEIDDLGVYPFTNNIITLGSGTSGGTVSKQQYTETFYAASTHSYATNTGLRTTNGSMYHGAYSGTNWQYSYIAWGAGSLGTSSLSVLLGGSYAINWAKLRLTCLHCLYDNGMQWGLHTSTSLGSQSYSAILNSGGTNIREGATVQNPLGGGQISALFAAGAYTVLAPDTADNDNPHWYGYFYGGNVPGGSIPAITVNYTH